MIIQTGKSGLNTDVAPALLPPDALTAGDSFTCVAGSVSGSRMRRRLFAIDIEPLFHYEWQNVDGEQKYLVSNVLSVYLYNQDGTYSDITPSTPFTDGAKLDFTDLNTVLVVNSDLDGLYYYDNTRLVPAPGWPSSMRAKSIAAIKYNLVAMNLTDNGEKFPSKLMWSKSAEEGGMPNVWTPALDNDAGDDILGESEAEILGAVQYRDMLWIVKADSIYRMAWVGGQYVYTIKRQTGLIEIGYPEAFCGCRNNLAIFSTDDVMLFDGTFLDTKALNRVSGAIRASSESGAFGRVQLLYAPSDKLLLLGLGAPNSNVITKVFGYSLIDDTWSVFNVGFCYGLGLTSGFISGSREIIFYTEIEAGGANYQIEVATDYYDPQFDNEYILQQTSAERTGIPLNEVMMVTKALPRIRGVPVTITIGTQETQDSPVKWGLPKTVQPGQETFVPVMRSGRFLAYTIAAESKQRWSCDALDVRANPMGDKA